MVHGSAWEALRRQQPNAQTQPVRISSNYCELLKRELPTLKCAKHWQLPRIVKHCELKRPKLTYHLGEVDPIIHHYCHNAVIFSWLCFWLCSCKVYYGRHYHFLCLSVGESTLKWSQGKKLHTDVPMESVGISPSSQLEYCLQAVDILHTGS